MDLLVYAEPGRDFQPGALRLVAADHASTSQSRRSARPASRARELPLIAAGRTP
jgi:hypothetical protein